MQIDKLLYLFDSFVLEIDYGGYVAISKEEVKIIPFDEKRADAGDMYTVHLKETVNENEWKARMMNVTVDIRKKHRRDDFDYERRDFAVKQEQQSGGLPCRPHFQVTKSFVLRCYLSVMCVLHLVKGFETTVLQSTNCNLPIILFQAQICTKLLTRC